MSTVPMGWAGAIAVIVVAELTTKLVAGVPPKDTAVAPVKFAPVMITDVPPAGVPELGLTDVTVGVGVGTKVNWSLALTVELPVGVVTMTSIVPAASAGAVA